MEYFSRKLGVQNEAADSASQPRNSHAENSGRSSTGSLSSYLLKIKRDNELLKKNDEKLGEMLNDLQTENNQLSLREEGLEKLKKTCSARHKLILKQEEKMKSQLSELLQRKERISEKKLMIEQKKQSILDLQQQIESKKELLASKRRQLYQRERDVKNMKGLLEDAKAEKYETSINHILFHSKETEDIHVLNANLPADHIRLSMICKNELDAIGLLKNRQAAIYAFDLAPSDPNFIHLQHLKKQITKQKKANLHLFHQVKLLNQKVGRATQ